MPAVLYTKTISPRPAGPTARVKTIEAMKAIAALPTSTSAAEPALRAIDGGRSGA